MKYPTVLTDKDLSIIEKFVVHTYSSCCEKDTVNGAQEYLFTKNNSLIEKLPPTQDALKQHVLRAAYQGNVWEQMLEKFQQLADPEKCGWKFVDGEYLPEWMNLPEVTIAFTILTSCGCKLNVNVLRQD